jgi:hypothetical protein
MRTMLSPQSINLTERVMALWTVFLLGTLLHTPLALMSGSNGLSIVPIAVANDASMTSILWFMLTFFMLPMLMLIVAALMPLRRFRAVHFGLTLLYSGFNILHFGLDVLADTSIPQLVLMAFLVWLGLLLNVVGYRWWQTTHDQRLWMSV